jgi:Glyoxalase-like domain
MDILSIVLDCADPERLGPFWSAATGYRRVWSDDTWILLAPTERGKPQLLLQRVPEPKSGKNRMHIDLVAQDLDADVARLVSLGATRGERRRLGDIAEWNVMADPDGNEFCISAPHQAS